MPRTRTHRQRQAAEIERLSRDTLVLLSLLGQALTFVRSCPATTRAHYVRRQELIAQMERALGVTEES